MSDSEGDFSDELLELAGATEKKRRKRQGSSSKPSMTKKRKADASIKNESASDDGPESEEDESNPYPLEGKYINEVDRNRLMQMSEIEREELLAQRLEEMQRLQDKRNLDQMVKAQKDRGGGDPDGVAKAAKRQHTVRGATKEKSRKLDELKARRKAKDERKRPRTDSPKRDRSSSPMDMETSSGEEEDGQISKFEEEEEKERRMLTQYGKAHVHEEPATLEDLNKCRLSRDTLAKYCMAPWFEDFVKGAWVRYLIGEEHGGGPKVYRICEIQNLAVDLVKPYKINDQIINQAFELKHGRSTKVFHMDKVSNAPFEPKEFERLTRTCAVDNVKLPSRSSTEKKVAQMDKLKMQPITESDITAMLARKSTLQAKKLTIGQITMERSRLMQARTLAYRRQDLTEVAEIDAKLAELPVTNGIIKEEEDLSDRLAKVNERNRKANIDAVRKAELLEAERKRRDRKLAATGASGTATPPDPSARLKTIPRTFDIRDGTPNANGHGTPSLQATSGGPRSISPLPIAALARIPLSSPSQAKSLEASVIDSIELDLGDF